MLQVDILKQLQGRGSVVEVDAGETCIGLQNIAENVVTQFR